MAETAVEGRQYRHTHATYGEVTVTAVKVPTAKHCKPRLLCRCGCGMEAKNNIEFQGYAAACLTRLTTEANVAAARAAHGGTLPEYKGKTKETVGTYCHVNGVEGQAVKCGDGTLWKPFCSCGRCWRLTPSSGQKHANGCAFNAKCTRVVDGVQCTHGQYCGGLCTECYKSYKYRPCPTPGCKRTLRNGHTLCQACERKAKVEAKRQAHLPDLLKLVAAGARDGRDVKSWEAETNTIYVLHNLQDDHRPQLVLRCGKRWVPACVCRTDNGSVCPHVARRGDDGMTTRCVQHGGGPRCCSGAHGDTPPWGGYFFSDACTSVPLRGKHGCMDCLRRMDGSNPVVKNYVQKEDMVLAGVAECLVELGRGELCLGAKARMVQDCVTGKSKRRMDTCPPMPTDRVVCDVENDEGQHKDREQSCEDRKLAGHFIDKGAPEDAGASSKPAPKLYAIRFNCDGYVDDQGVRHPGLFNTSGIPKEDDGRKLKQVNPRFKAACMLLARTIIELYDNCTDPAFVEQLQEWTVVYLRYDGCRADGTDPGGVREAVAQRVVGAKEKAQIAAMHRNAKRAREARVDGVADEEGVLPGEWCMEVLPAPPPHEAPPEWEWVVE